MSILSSKKSECVRGILKVGIFKSQRVATSFIIAFSFFIFSISIILFLRSEVAPTSEQNLASTYGSTDQSIFKISEKNKIQNLK